MVEDLDFPCVRRKGLMGDEGDWGLLKELRWVWGDPSSSSGGSGDSTEGILYRAKVKLGAVMERANDPKLSRFGDVDPSSGTSDPPDLF